MFIWLAASFWLLLSFLTCSKGRKKKYLPTAPRKQTLFDYGVGWLHVETEELNNLPIKFLSLLGVLHQLSNPPSALRDPKSFDDSGDESGPPRARQLRKPSQVSHTKRLLLNTTYDIGAVLCVMGVFVSLVALLSGLLCLLGKIYNWSFSVKENSPASGAHDLSHLVFTHPHQLARRAILTAHESPFLGARSYPDPDGNRILDQKPEPNTMLLQLAASHLFTSMPRVTKDRGRLYLWQSTWNTQ